MTLNRTKCANLDPGGVAKRHNTGIVAGIAALIIAVVLATGEWSPWWRLILFPILYAALVGFLQARSATCVYLAVRGAHEIDGRVEQVSDAEEVVALRRKGRRIMIQSVLAAAMLTAIIVFV